jgi:hypothetical protein
MSWETKMKKQVLMGAVASFLLLSVGAASADSTVAAFMGNTLHAVSADLTYDVFYNEDGSYSTSMGENGAWEVKDGDMCHTPEGQDQNCVPHQADKNVGDAWDVTDIQGTDWTISIVEGRP